MSYTRTTGWGPFRLRGEDARHRRITEAVDSAIAKAQLNQEAAEPSPQPPTPREPEQEDEQTYWRRQALRELIDLAAQYARSAPTDDIDDLRANVSRLIYEGATQDPDPHQRKILSLIGVFAGYYKEALLLSPVSKPYFEQPPTETTYRPVFPEGYRTQRSVEEGSSRNPRR